jgi:poly(hydroxyalkanoate) granule-associated protein
MCNELNLIRLLSITGKANNRKNPMANSMFTLKIRPKVRFNESPVCMQQNLPISTQGTEMAKKLKKAIASSKSAGSPVGEFTEKVAAMASNLAAQPSAKQVMESAQQIWLAGLGAFSKAQTEGRKMFDTLVKQGEGLEKHTRTVAEATIETAKEQAGKTFGMASGKFDKLEQVFEERVHKSLNRLGVLTSKDVEALSAQVAELSDAVRGLLAQEKRAPAARKAPAQRAARPAAKKPAPVAKKVVRKTTRK